MEFKGTPGQWQRKFIGSEPEMMIVSDHIEIASVNRYREEYKANAQLIVKAPEMLEMLRKLYAEDLLKDNADDVLKLIQSATEL
ncbi:hypothetical protein [Chryseobacterium indologenes]|uniref:Uncharacterized protein n=1 Tax=Chryseobacterium indologenes TaxID=253 RepID=A0A0N0IW20_CHRID|nr:hypothetical protein [Chryseobacterium indologenes]KPE51011.1 hypothetical protein AOB46_12555 [Chryseobacterium indologenes]